MGAHVTAEFDNRLFRGSLAVRGISNRSGMLHAKRGRGGS